MELWRHGLSQSNLEEIIMNPYSIKWTLKKSQNIQFFAELQDFLKKAGLTVEEVGMVYTSINPRLCQFSSSNKDACTKISSIICGQISSETLLEPRTLETQTEMSDYTRVKRTALFGEFPRINAAFD